MKIRPPLVVSDHAVMRLLERKYGVDLDEMRREIAAAVNDAYQAGALAVKIDGLAYTIRGNCVVTVQPCARRETRRTLGFDKRPSVNRRQHITEGLEG